MVHRIPLQRIFNPIHIHSHQTIALQILFTNHSKSHAYQITPPFYVLEQILDQMETPSDGTCIQIPIPEEPPRHITLISSHYNVNSDDKMHQVMVQQIRALKYSEDENSNVGSRQSQFYQMTQTLLDDKILRAPTPAKVTKALKATGLAQPIVFLLSFIRSTWMVCDFKCGKDFRCDACPE